MYLIYIDDSGDEEEDLLAGIAIPVDRWSASLRVWLNWRRFLYRSYGIPADFELHAEQFLKPRKNPVPVDHGRSDKVAASLVNQSVGVRKELYRRSLETLRWIGGVRIVAVRRPDNDRLATYRRMLEVVTEFLAADDERAICMVDGFDTRLRSQHRLLELATRVVLEDPWHEHSHHSQFLQIADLVAYAGYQHVARNESRRFMWDWYPQLLGEHVVACPGGCACGIDGHDLPA